MSGRTRHAAAFGLLFAFLTLGSIPARAVGETAIPGGVLRFAPDVIRASHAYEGLQGFPAARVAQMWQESRGNPAARSPVGARGLFQFMPATEGWLGEIMPDLGPADAYNPRWAIQAGIRYQVRLERKHRACPPCARVWYGLREYNGGGIKADLDAAEAAGNPRCDYRAAEGFNGRRRSAAALRENINYPRAIIERWQPAVMRRFLVRGVNCGGEP